MCRSPLALGNPIGGLLNGLVETTSSIGLVVSGVRLLDPTPTGGNGNCSWDSPAVNGVGGSEAEETSIGEESLSTRLSSLTTASLSA